MAIKFTRGVKCFAVRTDVKLGGSSGDDIPVGHAGDDVLNGHGGHDVFRGGAGNDKIRISDTDITSIDAGTGRDDIVQFTGSNMDFDCRNFADDKLTGIEAFDLTGKGNNSLTIAADDMFHFSTVGNKEFTAADSHNNLVVYGDSGDTLALIDYTSSNAHWQLEASDRTLAGGKHGTFDFYDLVDADNNAMASVAVDHSVGLTL